METYRSIGLFTCSFGAGWLASLAFVPWGRISRNFFRLNAGFALAFAATGAGLVWWGAGGEAMPLVVAAAGMALLCLALLMAPDAPARGLLWIVSAASLGVVAHEAKGFWPGLSNACGGIAMGTVMSTMILGHWYLAGPGLSFDLLVRASKVFLGTVVLRLGVVLAVLLACHDVGTLAGVASPNMTKEFNAWLLWIRIVAGIGVPLLFAWMVWQCAKIKSNQSATGILYATILFVLVGELLAQYYQARTGVPV